MTTDAIKKAVEIVGTQSQLAKVCNVSFGMVNQWCTGRRQVAAEHCPVIERATAGAVRCEQLRPDVHWGYLRGTDCESRPAEHQEAA